MLVIRLILGTRGNDLLSDTISPFTGSEIHGTIELVHSDGLGVQDVMVSLLIIFLSSKSGLSCSEDLVVSGLTTTGRSNDHETMSNNGRVEKLENFLSEGLNWLDMHGFARLNNRIKQDTSVNDWLLGRWEQINDNVLEQGQIILEELWHVDISEGSQQ